MAFLDDDLGGDPPCWAHLLDDEAPAGDAAPGAVGAGAAGVVDLAALARGAAGPGVAWSGQSTDLDANLLVFARGDGVAIHVNDEVDVLIVALAGEGILEIGDVRRPLRAGQAVLVAKGTRRGITSASDPFAYLTCHRRRAGLWPAPRA